MSTTAGVWSETLLQNVRERAEALMFDDRIKQQYTPVIGAVDALKRVQTANIRALKNGLKNNTVEVEWLNYCGLTVANNVACDTGGTEGSTNTETYTLDVDKMVKFKVQEADFRDNDFGMEEAVAKGLLRADMLISESFAQQFVTELNAAKGVNAYTGAPGTVSGSDTYIASGNWDYTLYAYLLQAADVNKFTAPVLLNGNNLYRAFINAQFAAGNADGKAGAAAFGALPTYFDIHNLPAVNSTTEISYLLSQGSWAWASAPKFETSLRNFQHESRYSFESRFIPGLWLNVQIVESCVEDYVSYDFKVSSKYGIFANPAGCTATNTGTLTFICGTAS